MYFFPTHFNINASFPATLWEMWSLSDNDSSQCVARLLSVWLSTKRFMCSSYLISRLPGRGLPFTLEWRLVSWELVSGLGVLSVTSQFCDISQSQVTVSFCLRAFSPCPAWLSPRVYFWLVSVRFWLCLCLFHHVSGWLLCLAFFVPLSLLVFLIPLPLTLLCICHIISSSQCVWLGLSWRLGYLFSAIHICLLVPGPLA